MHLDAGSLQVPLLSEGIWVLPDTTPHSGQKQPTNTLSITILVQGSSQTSFDLVGPGSLVLRTIITTVQTWTTDQQSTAIRASPPERSTAAGSSDNLVRRGLASSPWPRAATPSLRSRQPLLYPPVAIACGRTTHFDMVYTRRQHAASEEGQSESMSAVLKRLRALPAPALYPVCAAHCNVDAAELCIC